MDGLRRSANYAFAPNFLKYCGPDKNRELAGYLQFKASDDGLKELLSHFAAMHPYLKLIAEQNNVRDEFDNLVVEAYWLGNRLLDKVSLNSFYQHIKPRLPKRDLRWFELKLPTGAKPNHQFHVLNFFIRTGHRQIIHTVETMDQCRISWGRLRQDGRLNSQQLVYREKKLLLIPAIKTVKNLVNDFKAGDLVTAHWGWICEKITPVQAKNLEIYSRLALGLANKTV